MALEECPNNYCGKNKKQIDGDCHDLDYQAGNKIILQGIPGMPRCWCVCSCLAVDTPVTTPDGTVKVQDIVPDETVVLAAGRGLAWTPTVVTQASFATPGLTEHAIYIQYLLNGEEKGLIVTRDQPLLLANRSLIVADQLQLDDQLIDRDGTPVQVTDVHWGSYSGNFYEFATKMEPPDAELDDHLVLINGIVSGDFAIQVYTRIDVSDNAAPERPGVGSEEWVEKHADRSSQAATTLALRSGDTPAAAATRSGPYQLTGSANAGPAFVPAEPVTVPAHAADFLPPWQAMIVKRVAPHHPTSDPYYHQLLDWLLRQFRCLYPDIEFLTDWYSGDPNSHSWIDYRKGFVLVKGAMARLDALEMEGLALVVAHEVGHLLGVPDGSPTGVTCEGEADYYGAKIVLRKLWFGEYYADNVIKAVDQVQTVFEYVTSADGYESKETQDVAAAMNKYPSIECREATFLAAQQLAPKPECAACGTPA
jgi:hypothetical protein